MVEGLSSLLQRNVQAVVDLLELWKTPRDTLPRRTTHSTASVGGVGVLSLTFAGHVTDQLPALDEVGLFALQSDNTLICPLLKDLVLIKALLGLLRDSEQNSE